MSPARYYNVSTNHQARRSPGCQRSPEKQSVRFLESLRIAFENCQDPIVVSDAIVPDLLDGPVLYANAAFLQQTGYLPEDVVGRPQRNLLASESQGASLPKESLAGAKSQLRLPLTARSKNGLETRVETTAWLIRGPAGLNDYAAFQQRPESRERRRVEPDLFELARASVVAVDLAGNITRWNPGATLLTGYSETEMLGRSVELLFPDEHRSQVQQVIIPTLLKDGSLDIVIPLKKKDGYTAHLGLALSVIPDASGAPAGFLGVSVDVTNLKLCEIALQANNALLTAIRRLQSIMISAQDKKVALKETLTTLLTMTGSEHGFMGELRTGGSGMPHISTYAVQTRSEDPKVLDFFQANIGRMVEFHRPDSLIGHVMRHKEAVLTNAPSSDVRSTGVPPGHPSILSFAGLPLKIGDEMIGMLGLANRPGGYDQALISNIQPLLECCAAFIDVYRNRNTARALGETLERAFANSRDALVITDQEGNIINWNPEAERLLGYSQAEAVRTNLAALRGNWDSWEMPDILSSAKQHGNWSKEITFRSQSGTEVDTEAMVISGDEHFNWVIRDIGWRKKADRALQEASDRFDALAQNTHSAFWMATKDGTTILYRSPACETIGGVPVSGFPTTSKPWTDLIHPEDYEGFQANRRIYIQGVPVRQKYRIIRPDGKIRWIDSYVFPVKNPEGEIYRIAGLLEDITDQEEADARLRSALGEKEALLQEIHHRVKNNLQIISSLLRLQTASTADAVSSAVLQESRARVDTIALIHEHLYQSGNVSRISFPAYAGRLVANVISVNQVTPERIKVSVDIGPLNLDPQTAVLCGLILNELVSNSLRHAFPSGRKGEITIASHVEAGAVVVMNISDNGVGLPQDFDVSRVNTLGLRLVRQLTRQMKGTMSVSSHNGTAVRVEFPVQEST